MTVDRFESLITADDVIGELKDNEEELVELIPELKDMIGFDQKNRYHHLDLWNHTLLAMALSEPDLEIRLALLLHDIGKPHSYTEVNGERNYKGHPKVSSEIARPILERLGYDKEFIDEVCYLIKEHDMPTIEKMIEDNVELLLKLSKVRLCDELAHNMRYQEKNKKSIEKNKRLTLINLDYYK